MTIAVNTVTAGLPDADTSFLLNHALQLAQQQPQHQFIIICRPAVTIKVKAANITYVLVKQQLASPLRLQYWLRFTLPGILKKHNALLVLQNNYCLLKSKLPQVLFISDLSFYKYPDWYKNSWLQFYKKNMPAFTKKATAIVTASLFIKNEFTANNTSAEAKIIVQPTVIDAAFTATIHWQQKEIVKDKFTAGKEYFLYSGLIDSNKNLVMLLKAFTFFKQRQKSNMQLVLLSEKEAQKKFLQLLSSYKYKKEILVAENCSIADRVAITAAAYALVHPLLYDGTGQSVMQAIHCGVPVIVAQQASLQAYCGDAALYCDATNFNDISDKMMQVFKNEDQRHLLIANGREIKQHKKTVFSADLLQKWAAV